MPHLQVDSVAVSLSGSKILGIITRLHVISSDLHVYLMPRLQEQSSVSLHSEIIICTFNSLQFAALSVTSVILQGMLVICSTSRVILAALDFQYSTSTCGPKSSLSILSCSLSTRRSCMDFIHCFR